MRRGLWLLLAVIVLVGAVIAGTAVYRRSCPGLVGRAEAAYDAFAESGSPGDRTKARIAYYEAADAGCDVDSRYEFP